MSFRRCCEFRKFWPPERGKGCQKRRGLTALEEGRRTRNQQETPQGGSASPLLANVYLHYVFDLWVQRWRRTQVRGDMIVVRYPYLAISCARTSRQSISSSSIEG